MGNSRIIMVEDIDFSHLKIFCMDGCMLNQKLDTYALKVKAGGLGFNSRVFNQASLDLLDKLN